MSNGTLTPPIIIIDTADDVKTGVNGAEETNVIEVKASINEAQTTIRPEEVKGGALDTSDKHNDAQTNKTSLNDATKQVENDMVLNVPDIITASTNDAQHNARNVAYALEQAKDTQNSLKVPSTSGATPNGSPKSRRRHQSKEDLKHLSQDDLLLAETLIKDAESGRNFLYKTEPVYVRFYILYHKWYFRWTLYLFILLNMCLAFMEKPTQTDWEQPYWMTMILEAICLIFFIARVIHLAYFSLPHVFWRDTKNIIVIGLIALTILDMICYIIWVNVGPDKHPVRWSRPLRALYIINFSDGRQIRRAFRNIRRTVPEIANVIVLFILIVLLFALLAFKLFGRRHLTYPDGTKYFTDYLDSFWDLYVLVTTANNPDVMMPAYDYSKWFAIFFFIYLVICLYVFMSIVLAAIYNTYRKNLKNEIKMAVFNKRKKLKQAFEILKVSQNGQDIITRSVWSAVMTRVLPKKSPNQIELLMTILDAEGTGTISKANFLNLVNLLQVPVSEVMERLTFLEKRFPTIYNSSVSNFVKIVVRHKFFRFFFDLMIFTNAFFIGADIDDADWFFLSIFLVEIILKLYVYGPVEFFHRFWNIFDFFVIIGAFIATSFEAAEGDGNIELSTLDVLLILRVLRLIKFFGSIKRFKVILMTIVNIIPSIVTYGGVMFVMYYLFAIIGMEMFHGQIRYFGDATYNTTDPAIMFCGTKKLNGSWFYQFHYCNNNFNDIRRSFVLLFELTVVNQWHVLSSGFVFVTNKAFRLYFFSFHMVCVVIVMNIFVAFILEAFILEYSLQRAGKFESAVEAKIKALGLGIGQTVKKGKGPPQVDKIELVNNEEEMGQTTPPITESDEEKDSDTDSIPDLSNERGVRFHLRKKSRKKVEVLLQQMFEGEIDPEEEDKDDSEEVLIKIRSRTLDSVTDNFTGTSHRKNSKTN